MISKESHHMYSMVSVPDSPPEALWQQYKSGLQRCGDALLRRQPQPRAPWIPAGNILLIHTCISTFFGDWLL